MSRSQLAESSRSRRDYRKSVVTSMPPPCGLRSPISPGGWSDAMSGLVATPGRTISRSSRSPKLRSRLDRSSIRSGEPGLVLDGDEQHAASTARLLPDQHDARHDDPTAVARVRQMSAGDRLPAREFLTQECDRVAAQAETGAAVVLDNLQEAGELPSVKGALPPPASPASQCGDVKAAKSARQFRRPAIADSEKHQPRPCLAPSPSMPDTGDEAPDLARNRAVKTTTCLIPPRSPSGRSAEPRGDRCPQWHNYEKMVGPRPHPEVRQAGSGSSGPHHRTGHRPGQGRRAG